MKPVMSMGKDFPMEFVSLALPALGYVILQFIALDRLRGTWRSASVLTAMLIATLVILSVAAQLSGWPEAAAGLGIAVPLGLCCLTALLLLSEVSRVIPHPA